MYLRLERRMSTPFTTAATPGHNGVSMSDATKQLCIKSDGTAHGTKVFVNGVRLTNVASLRIEGNAEDHLLKVHLTLWALGSVEIEIDGQVNLDVSERPVADAQVAAGDNDGAHCLAATYEALTHASTMDHAAVKAAAERALRQLQDARARASAGPNAAVPKAALETA